MKRACGAAQIRPLPGNIGRITAVPLAHLFPSPPLSIPASVGDAAPATAADAVAAGGGAAEGPLPLPQHQAGQQPGLGLPAPGPRLQPVSSARA